MVRSLSALLDQAEDDVSRAVTGDDGAARLFYDRAAALLPSLPFYAEECGLDGRWVHEVVAAGNVDSMREVARVFHQRRAIQSLQRSTIW
jgi:hypothetical protein